MSSSTTDREESNVPTRVGLISDIHGNHIALQAVLEDMGTVDALVCAGDVVGYGPSPDRCLQTIRDRDIPTVQGNHDRGVGQGECYESGGEYAREVLSDEETSWLQDLPRQQTLFDGRLKMVHDHPEKRNKYTTPALFDPDLLDDEDILVLGHTHIQHVEEFDTGTVVNPGSVGQPRDGKTSAAYGIVDLEERTVELHRVPYDIYRVEIRIRDTSISNKNGDRLSKGK